MVNQSFFRIGVLLLSVLCACSGNSSRDNRSARNAVAWQTITAETAYGMMKNEKNYVLLDVRTEEEFQNKHIEGALLIPHYELEDRAAAEMPDKDAFIFIYCQAGARSVTAAKILVEIGYTKVYNFGGITHWPYGTVP